MASESPGIYNMQNTVLRVFAGEGARVREKMPPYQWEGA